MHNINQRIRNYTARMGNMDVPLSHLRTTFVNSSHRLECWDTLSSSTMETYGKRNYFDESGGVYSFWSSVVVGIKS